MIKFKETKDLVGMYLYVIVISILCISILLAVIGFVLKMNYGYDTTYIAIITTGLLIIGVGIILFN